MDGIAIMWCVGSAAAGFLLGYFYRVGLENADGGIIDEQERGITIGPGYQPRRNPDAPVSRSERPSPPPAPPGPRSAKPRKPRRKR
jgi:hypothetical protein